MKYLDPAQRALLGHTYRVALSRNLRAWRTFDRNALKPRSQALVFAGTAAVALRDHGPLQLDATWHDSVYTTSPWVARMGDWSGRSYLDVTGATDPEQVDLGHIKNFYGPGIFAGPDAILSALAIDHFHSDNEKPLLYPGLRYIGMHRVDLDQALGSDKVDKMRDAALATIGSVMMTCANVNKDATIRPTSISGVSWAALHAHAYGFSRDDILSQVSERAATAHSTESWVGKRAVVHLATPFVDTVLALSGEIKDYLTKD